MIGGIPAGFEVKRVVKRPAEKWGHMFLECEHCGCLYRAVQETE